MKALKFFSILITIILLIPGCEKEEESPQKEEEIPIVSIDPGSLEAFFDVEYQIIVSGPIQLYKSDSTSCKQLRSFTIKGYDYLTEDYYVVIRNGNKNDEGRVEDAKITINGEEIFGAEDFSKDISSLFKKVPLEKNIELIAEINDKYSELITIWIFGTHSGPGSAFLPEEAYPGQTGEIVTYEIDGGEITCEKINDQIIFQGDMILTEDQINSLTLKGASIKSFSNWRWPNNKVFYDIAKNCPYPEYIAAAISEIESKTSLVFEEAGVLRPNYITFRKAIELIDEGMHSHVGMIGGQQYISVPISWGTTTVKGCIMHEICHAVGMIHEHSRSDRDDYVIINEDRIKKGKKINFKKYENSLDTDLFDFGSIMMYPEWAFTTGGSTIIKIDSSINWEYNREKLSAQDIEMLNMMYPKNVNPNQPPVANFEADIFEVYVGQQVQFTDHSIYNPTKWEWDFGDGSQIKEIQNPSHSYNIASRFDVQLIAENEHGKSEPEIKEEYIRVYPLTIPDFRASKRTITEGESVIFYNESEGSIVSYKWDFGDGSYSEERTVSHQYDTPENYTVSLEITDRLGITYTKTEPNYITVLEKTTDFVEDVDENRYTTRKIGDQWWMAENLRTTKYPNGTDITPVRSDGAWSELSVNAKAYCWYDDEISNKYIRGALYTWSAAIEACPDGWHVPSDAEWKEMEMVVGLTQTEADALRWRGTDEGSKLKANSELWFFSNNGTNDFGFSAIPGGVRYDMGACERIEDHARFWTSTDNDSDYPVHRILSSEHTEIFRYDSGNTKDYGYSVRCIKD